MKESWSLKAHQKEKDGHRVAVDVPQWQRGYMKHIAAIIQLKGKSFTGCCVALHFSPSAAWWLLWAQGPQLERGFGYEESPVWQLNYSAMVQTSIQTSYTLNIKIWMADAVLWKCGLQQIFCCRLFLKVIDLLLNFNKQQSYVNVPETVLYSTLPVPHG